MHCSYSFRWRANFEWSLSDQKDKKRQSGLLRYLSVQIAVEVERVKSMESEFRKAHESQEAQLQVLRGQLKHSQEEVRIHQQKKAQVETQLEASRERESRLSSSVAESNRLKLDNEALVSGDLA